jgi:glycosyltransferase involved in cell wall biosynthesis
LVKIVIFAAMSKFKVSIVISTYNHPIWLQKVLWSYELQSEKNFEIIIADDGSTSETKLVIDEFIKNSTLQISHVWQEDNGFRKTKILNKAILQANADYLIFSDGDCIARQDFVAKHLMLRKKNRFLSAGYIKLSKEISKSISKENLVSQACFEADWLLALGLKKNFKINKLTSFGFKEWFLNTFTPTKATWDGCNVSGWKEDVLKVNGFDERMEYGGEDREIGERLSNLGVKGMQARYSLILLHLHHKRPYKNETSAQKNKKIRAETKRAKSGYTNFGIVQDTD